MYFPSWSTWIDLTLVGITRIELVEWEEMVLDDVGWNPGAEHDLCVVRPSGCYPAYFGEV